MKDEYEQFPYIFVGTFIEALTSGLHARLTRSIPFLFGGAFIEAATAG